MKRVRYPAEFKVEAVKQLTELGHEIIDVAKRLAKEQPGVVTGESASLKAELKRANEERDILNKAATYFAKLSG